MNVRALSEDDLQTYLNQLVPERDWYGPAAFTAKGWTLRLPTGDFPLSEKCGRWRGMYLAPQTLGRAVTTETFVYLSRPVMEQRDHNERVSLLAWAISMKLALEHDERTIDKAACSQLGPAHIRRDP